ncbi:MAG: SDR family NAD(P)-dependent oxidoreductase [Spirochaetales bacterium]|nr:SDR family NAD(P)-dependent oxidoreductase [Spirochaetales bacterium]
MMFHPTLIDGSALAFVYLIADDQAMTKKGELLIPLSFESFYSNKPFPTHCYTLVRKSSIRIVNDIIVFQLDFFDATGTQFAMLQGITAKAVRSQNVMTFINKTAHHIPAPVNTDSKEKPAIKNQIKPGENSIINNMEFQLKKIFSHFLDKSVSQIDSKTSFFELGLESSMLLKIVKEIETTFNLSLNTSLLFEYHNMNELIAYLKGRVPENAVQTDHDNSKVKEKAFSPVTRNVSVKSLLYDFSGREDFISDYLVDKKPALMSFSYPCIVIDSYINNNPASYPLKLKNIRFSSGPVTLNKTDKIKVQVTYNGVPGNNAFETRVGLNDISHGITSCTGDSIETILDSNEYIDIHAIINKSHQLDGDYIENCYHTIKDYSLGPELRIIEELYEYNSLTQICKVNLTERPGKEHTSSFVFDPVLLFSCFILSNYNTTNEDYENTILPITIENLIVYRGAPEKVYIVKNIRTENKYYTSFDAIIVSESGEIIAEIINASIKFIRHTELSLLNNMPKSPSTAKESRDIAIIGLSGRYPGAGNIDEFYNNLKNARDSITEIPEKRWSWKKYFNEDRTKSGTIYCKWGGFIDGVDEFDPLFFNISPTDAEIMDPQERLFLECCFNVLEDAGYTRNNVGNNSNSGSGNKVGVYVGVMWDDYQLHGVTEQLQGRMVALSDNASSIANRVSYIFNLHGPSMVLNTACSSSLSAIHLACQSIINKESEVALAGGVNICIHPNKYLFLSNGGFISSKGRCESFGIGADGYVPGEGVGALLLKPLEKAINDGDHIYGIIKGSMINAGGKTSGFTVPSPKAQGEVIHGAIEASGVDPRTISYIETHGTGTSLGDPIEIKGLTDVFKKYTTDKKFCRIGSVKSNIGHLESAAGIAGITKILLQLKHGQIVPSLHSETLNPNIDFENTPFIVQQDLTEWKRPVIEVDGEKKEFPRRAGISSFGAGGANAHIIIEEYIPLENETPEIVFTPQYPAVVLLSAKDGERLKEYAKRLLAFINEKQLSGSSLADLVYTLQTGREANEERMALIVSSIEELKGKLNNFVEGHVDIEKLYRGHVKHNEDTLAVFDSDDDMDKTIDAWIAKRKLTKLAGVWVQGLDVDWNKLYDNVKPRRISLPTYPFAKEHYWIPETEAKEKSIKDRSLTGFIHPLLHHNTSDFFEQRFTSSFTGHEFFLNDHIVNGSKVLPGVAYLEMVRVAVEYASGALKEGYLGFRLKNIVWIRPLAVGAEGIEVHIGLNPSENGEIAYEVYSDPDENNGESIIYNQGVAYISFTKEAPVLDLKTLQSECSGESIDISTYYEDFKRFGIEYGPGFKGIESFYEGDNKALAKISLPSSVVDTQDQYIMHPSLMDSALHALAGLMALSDDTAPGKKMTSHKPILPFALDELELFNNCTDSMWAFIRYSDTGKKGDNVNKVDIDLCDDKGNISVRMRGFSTRTLEGEISNKEKQESVSSGHISPPVVGSVVLSPVWDPVKPEKAEYFPSQKETIVIMGGTKENISAILHQYPEANVIKIGSRDSINKISEKLKKYKVIDHLVWIAPSSPLKSLTGDSLIKEQNNGVLQGFKVIKSMLSLGYNTKALGWTVITTQALPVEVKDSINPAHASIHGLIGTMAKEYPNWKIRLIDLEGEDKNQQLSQGEGVYTYDWPVNTLFTLPFDSRGRSWVYRDKEWYRQQLVPIHKLPTEKTMYRTDGVYVVIGGAGSVGQAWTEYMIKTYHAHIIWIGRREKDAAIQAVIDSLAAFGPPPLYIRADATDLKSLNQAYAEIKQYHPQIHGVIHSALDLVEQSLSDLDEKRFKAGLSVKIDVSVRMTQVFCKEPLDFILFFSSIVSFIKNPRQSYYAAGCTFKDAFAHQLSLELPCKVKVMNWGYWSTDEAKASERVQILSQIGIDLIESPEAMEALETLLAGEMNQIGLMKTNKTVEVEGMNPGEFIINYPEKISSCLISAGEHINPREKEMKRIKSELEPLSDEMDELLCKLLWSQLHSLGIFKDKVSTIDELRKKVQLYNLYDRWLEESLAILARKNYLQFDGKSCHIIDTAPPEPENIRREWDQKKGTWLEDPNMRARVLLLDATMHALPEILTKKVLATDIIFPKSSMELVQGVYKNNPVSDYFNEVLADTVIAYINERLKKDKPEDIKILEIGAGTGGTSASVFAKLRENNIEIKEYCYTDLSRAFLMYAETEYGSQNPYLTYELFNVEKPLAGQDIKAGEYDMVIAANVLHATKNIRQTVRNSKAVLKKNGLILLNEMSHNNLFVHLTFGLLEGWWLHEDSEIRIPGCPGLFPEKWKSILESEGFYPVVFPAVIAHNLGQQIIAGESDGIVRQKVNNDPGVPPDNKSKINAFHNGLSKGKSLISQSGEFTDHEK